MFSDKWWLSHFKDCGTSVTCLVEDKSGSICGHKMVKHSANCRYHLATHGVGPPVPKATSKLSFSKSAWKLNEVEAIALAEGLLPFSIVEKEWFRRAFNPTVRCAETAAANTLAVESKLLEQLSAHFAGRFVTIAFDSGTVWNRYLAICMSDERGSALIGAVPDTAFVGAQLTTENITRVIKDTVQDLRNRGVHVVACVADNASNMQGVEVEGVITLRCAAHTIQLVAKDVIEECFEEEANFATNLQRTKPELHLPAPVVTRWNSLYRLFEKICSARNAIIEADATDINNVCRVEVAMLALKPFFVATQLVQGDGVTTFAAISAMRPLLQQHARTTVGRSIEKAVATRTHQLITSAELLVAFLAPSFNRIGCSKAVFDAVHEILLRMVALAAECHGDEVIGDTVSCEWQTFCSAPPPRISTVITAKDYAAYWVGHSMIFPRMATIVIATLGATPTEGAVERVFSKMKYQLDKSRTTLSPTLVSAQLFVNSAIAFLSGRVAADADVCAALSPEDFATVVDRYEAIAARRPEPVKRLRSTKHKCGMCEELLERHAENKSVECNLCEAWFAYECVAIPSHMGPTIANMPHWYCPKCRSSKATR